MSIWRDKKIQNPVLQNIYDAISAKEAAKNSRLEKHKDTIRQSDKGDEKQAELYEAQMKAWADAENVRRVEEGLEPNVTAEDMAKRHEMGYFDISKQELDAEANELFHSVKSKEQKEKRGIYNVQNNDKKSTIIYKDAEFADSVIKYERGKTDYIDNKGDTKSGFGAQHVKKHLDRNANGWVTQEELMNIGNAIRNTEPYENSGKRVYECYNNFW